MYNTILIATDTVVISAHFSPSPSPSYVPSQSVHTILRFLLVRVHRPSGLGLLWVGGVGWWWSGLTFNCSRSRWINCWCSMICNMRVVWLDPKQIYGPPNREKVKPVAGGARMDLPRVCSSSERIARVRVGSPASGSHASLSGSRNAAHVNVCAHALKTVTFQHISN